MKILSKLYSLVFCFVSFAAVLISCWGYFISKILEINTFVLLSVSFGFMFVFELFNLLKDRRAIKSFLVSKGVDTKFVANTARDFFLCAIFLYFGLVDRDDFSGFDKKLSLGVGIFFLFGILLGFHFKSKGMMDRREALPKNKKEAAEKQLSILRKLEPKLGFLVVIIILLYYLFKR